MTLPPPGQPDCLPAESAALFVYGTLAFPEVMQVLLGRVPDSGAASIAGWRIAALRDRVHAAMVNAEAIAYGRLIADLSTAE